MSPKRLTSTLVRIIHIPAPETTKLLLARAVLVIPAQYNLKIFLNLLTFGQDCGMILLDWMVKLERQMSEQEVIQKLRDRENRQRFMTNLRKRYQQYRSKGGDKPALEWALDLLGPAIWNELFQYKGSSYPVNLTGLGRRHARAIAQAARFYRNPSS